jgi:hypothetical protein
MGAETVLVDDFRRLSIEIRLRTLGAALKLSTVSRLGDVAVEDRHGLGEEDRESDRDSSTVLWE